MLKPGDLFLDDFEILSTLGEGGFATVYRARQRRLGRDVAIKVLRLDDAQAQKRFSLEAQLLSRLRDPATVTVHDFGEVDGLQFMVLEFVEGKTLRQVLDQEGKLGAQRTVAILEQIVSALVEAHDRGVLHRDIKPDNIMLFDHYGRTDRVKVLDFGIAKLISPVLKITEAGPATASGKTIGTPRYMSPEMLYGGAVSDASDMFSVGLVTYEMLMGERAVKSSSGVRVIQRMLDANPILIPPGADVPTELAALVNHLLEKKEENRLGTALETAQRIRALPPFPGETAVVGPADLAQLREQVVAAQIVDDEASTISDVELEPMLMGRAPQFASSQFDPKPGDPTDGDIHVAIEQLKADAVAARLRDDAAMPAQRREPEPLPELGKAPRPGAPLPPPPEDIVEHPATPRRQWRMPTARQIGGFGVLALAIVFAIGFLTGFVGVKTSIHAGHPLACGFGRTAMVIERHFEVFGTLVYDLGDETRCSRLE